MNPDIPRGISPALLVSQVKNTAPYIFAETFAPRADQPHLTLLRTLDPDAPLGSVEYFKLCLSAHHASVASFVPTDVDNAIRSKLWGSNLTLDELRAQAEIVLQSLHWSFQGVSTRFVKTQEFGILGGHHGEWFSTAVAAYAALRRRDPEFAEIVATAIINEVHREANIYLSFRDSKSGLELLKTCTLIAHNLGDLGRVVEMWQLPVDDPVLIAVYKAGHEPKTGLEILVEAGSMNKAFMADENHRHFALRGVKPLRTSPDFLLPIGPFFDAWGRTLSRHPGLSPKQVGEIAEALIAGREKLKTPTSGYARALAGIESEFPGGLQSLGDYLPARVFRELKAGMLRAQCSVSQARFEEQWANRALHHTLRQHSPSVLLRRESALKPLPAVHGP